MQIYCTIRPQACLSGVKPQPGVKGSIGAGRRRCLVTAGDIALKELRHSGIDADSLVNQGIANATRIPEKVRAFKNIAVGGVLVAAELRVAHGRLIQCRRHLDQRQLAFALMRARLRFVRCD